MGRITHNVSSAGFIVDPQSVDRLNGRQIDWDNVGEAHRETPGTAPVIVVVGAAGAAQNAVAIPVAALSHAIPSGTVLSFGTNKFARLTADAAAAAVALAVAAIPIALVQNDTATYAGTAGSGSKMLPAGTTVGDLLGAGKIGPRIVATNPAIGFLEVDAVEDSESAAVSGVGVIVGGILYETLLPDAVAGTLAAGIKTELAVAGASKGFLFETYEDDRT